jgi:hypothetical protein
MTMFVVINPIELYSTKTTTKKNTPQKTTKSNTKSKKSTSQKSKSSTNKNKSKGNVRKNIPPNSHIFIKDTLLASGIIYKKLLTTINGLKHEVNIIQVDLTNNKAEIEIIKGGNNVMELENLTDMLHNSKVDTSKKEIVAGINANFWRALTNYPIGPTIIGGEVAEMKSNKK